MWVRFDLAPRRALFLGHLDELPRAAALKKGLPRGPQQVVLTYGPAAAPRLQDRQSFLDELDRLPRSHVKRREPQGR
ncbi:MAG TPA: hypothetical protein VOA87_20105 [Thermoanaerobaculia bacterium]|nr:hypothetical protein [Thermoanaerobaculia bacterium]